MNIKKKIFWLFYLVSLSSLILFCSTVRLYATSIEEMTLKEMCTNSSHIVVAQVVSIQSFWGTDNKKTIFSEISLDVTISLRGQFKSGDRFSIFYLGGSIDGVTTMLVGAPRFVVDEKSLLLFSEVHSEVFGQNLGVVGLSQGKFNIFFDSVTGQENVIRDQMAIPLKVEKDGAILPLTDMQPILLETLLERIESYINE